MIAPEISVMASLTEVNLGNNSLGDEGTEFIATALKESTMNKLQKLLMFQNGIGPKGAAALAAYAAISASLTKLELRVNSLGDEGKAAIKEAVSGKEGFELNI